MALGEGESVVGAEEGACLRRQRWHPLNPGTQTASFTSNRLLLFTHSINSWVLMGGTGPYHSYIVGIAVCTRLISRSNTLFSGLQLTVVGGHGRFRVTDSADSCHRTSRAERCRRRFGGGCAQKERGANSTGSGSSGKAADEQSGEGSSKRVAPDSDEGGAALGVEVEAMCAQGGQEELQGVQRGEHLPARSDKEPVQDLHSRQG